MLIQQDAPQAVRDALRRVKAVPVRSELAAGWTPRDGPAITVTSDGTPERSAAWTREYVRIAAYAATGPEARQLIAEVDAYLTNPARPAGFLANPGDGLSLARDTDLNCWVASITVEVPMTRR